MLQKQSAALISIYEAANDSDGWNSSLDACVDYVDAYSANILFHENSDNSKWRYSLGSSRWRACSVEQMAKTIEYFEKFDARAWKFVHQHPKQTLHIDTDFWSDTVNLADREDYQFFRNELGFFRKAGSKLNDNRCWTDNIAFQFPAHLDAITERSLSRVRGLLPHAAKSIEMWRTFSILKSQYKAVLAALDHVKVGLCIAEPGGSIIVTNEEAQRILDLDKSLRLGDNKRLYCQSDTMQASINHAIESMCATSSGQNTQAECFGLVETRNQQQISIEVAPLRDAAGELANHFNGALITLVDLSSELEVDMTKIANACNLSPSEKDVSSLVVAGSTINAIAETRGVAIDTVKSQLKSCYRKIGCKSRVELVRMALKADPPVR